MGVAGLIAAAAVGSNAWSLRDRVFGSAVPPPVVPVATRSGLFAPVRGAAAAPTSLRSAPWWQRAAVLHGSGAVTTDYVAISTGAVQWRVRAGCQTGRIVVAEAGVAAPLVNAACPAGATGWSSRSGRVALRVTSPGAWRLTVEQQIEAPLVEAPLPMIAAAGTTVVDRGRFYGVDQTATGTATFYRSSSGAVALRLTGFFVTPTADLQLWLSPTPHPRNDGEALVPAARLIAPLQATAGSLNFKLPPGLDPSRFGSLVIWCAATDSAYAAATLSRRA